MGVFHRTAERLGLVVRESSPDSTGPMASITPGARPAAVSDELALSLDAVYRAVSLLSTAAGQLTMDVWRGPARIDPPSWVAEPDPWQPTATWLKETVTSLALRGNAYWRVRRNAANQPTTLTVLDPFDVTVSRTPGGWPVYHVAGEADPLTRRDLAHLALLRRPGRRNPYGLGPIQAAAETVIGAVDMRRQSDHWRDGNIPNGVLTSDQVLTNDTAQALKARFIESTKASEPAVLGSGTSYKPLLLTPQELQWLDSQQFNVTAMARLFGVPARLMLAGVDGSSATYTNQQQEDLSFVRWTLMDYLREIESAITWLLPRGNTARFNLDAILRADTKTRYEAHKIGIDAGFLDSDDVREIEGLPIKARPAQPQETDNA